MRIHSRPSPITQHSTPMLGNGADGIDTITEGTHERVVVDAARFNAKVAEKSQAARD
jgi:predicted thioesterase